MTKKIRDMPVVEALQVTGAVLLSLPPGRINGHATLGKCPLPQEEFTQIFHLRNITKKRKGGRE